MLYKLELAFKFLTNFTYIATRNVNKPIPLNSNTLKIWFNDGNQLTGAIMLLSDVMTCASVGAINVFKKLNSATLTVYCDVLSNNGN